MALPTPPALADLLKKTRPAPPAQKVETPAPKSPADLPKPPVIVVKKKALPETPKVDTRAPLTIANDVRNLRLVKTNYPDIDLTNPDALIEAMKPKYKDASIRRYLVSIINHFKALNNTAVCDLYRKRNTEMMIAETEKRQKQELTESELSKFVDWDTIVKAYAEIQKNPSVTAETKLLLSFYIRLPPVRCDYAKLTIYAKAPAEDKGNYIVLDKDAPFVKIKEHKTASIHGALVHPLPSELLTEINAYLESKPGLRVLFDMTEYAMSKRIIATFKRATGKQIGVNILRHAFITKFRGGDKSYLEKIKLANGMGHTVYAQEFYRRLPAAGAAGGAGAS